MSEVRKSIHSRSGRCALSAVVAFGISLTAAAGVALAGPPTHQPLPALDLNGSSTPAHEFNHACGVATDSEGDVYVASAGTSAVDVFGPNHEFLTAIADAQEPCGLAVNTEGGLYVSEKKTGDVVEYKPNIYPFAGTPIYGLASTVDGGGQAKGISVDTVDGRLYVAEGTRISVYDSQGNLGIDEVQSVLPSNATGGTYTLSFEGQKTAALPYAASHAEVQEALEALSTIGAGNVMVSEGESVYEGRDHKIVFTGALAHTAVSQIACDASGLTGSSPFCRAETSTEGFSGHIGEGDLSEAVGVAAYTNAADTLSNGKASPLDERYVYVADRAGDAVKVFGADSPYDNTDIRKMVLRRTVDGSQTPAGSFGLGAQGAYLAVDPGNEDPVSHGCAAVGEQACTGGHVLVYDALHKALVELDASGEYLDEISGAGFVDAAPTAMAVERSGSEHDGTIYVTVGAGAGAEVLAYASLPEPGRPSLDSLSRPLEGARGVAVDSHGDVYVAVEKTIDVFSPEGAELTSIEDQEGPVYLAVDSEGNVYASGIKSAAEANVLLYRPHVYPPAQGATYSAPVTIDSTSDIESGVAVDPASGHLFVSHRSAIFVYDSATHGSTLLSSEFAAGAMAGTENPGSIGVYDANGDVYVAKAGSAPVIRIVNPAGSRVLATITGAGSPVGVFKNSLRIAVDERNGHVIAFAFQRGVAEEFDASGRFVGQFGSFQNVFRTSDVAIDNSGGPTEGNVYVAFDEALPGTPDLWAFGPLSYGEPPVATTGSASEVVGGEAELAGTVDPRGAEVSECAFQYVSEEEYEASGFAGAASQSCAQSGSVIGNGNGGVAVNARLTGLQGEGRYRYRLLARNRYGESEGQAGLFGRPTITTERALVLYREATVRAKVDPFGLATSYRVEYGTSTAYGRETAEASLPAGGASVSIQAPVFGLREGTQYHYRVVARNEAGTDDGPDQTFVTQATLPSQGCANAAHRVGQSALLPDCRAYELVTPADTHGALPAANEASNGFGFDNWLVDPSGAGAGDRVSFFLAGSLLGLERNGLLDGLTATRGADGWHTTSFGPSYREVSEPPPATSGVASEQQYSVWVSNGRESELRGPMGVEAVGRGSLGVDPKAEVDMLTGEARQIVFSSSARLEPAAPPAGTTAVYERSPSGPTEVLSLLPGGVTPTEGENAAYVGISEDGSTVAFEVGGVLYVQRAAETVQVVAGPHQFASLSSDGTRVFYTTAPRTATGGIHSGEEETTPGDLYAVDLTTAGQTKIASNSLFVNVAADGSRVYFASTDRLDGAGEGVPGAENLYVWDGSSIRLVTVLAIADMEGFFGHRQRRSIASWVLALAANPSGHGEGRELSPTRSTSDGRVLVFQSHADLTGQDPAGYSQVYRYDAGDGSIVCVSCDPSGAAVVGEAALQSPQEAMNTAPTADTTLIPNVTEDGQSVVFETDEALVPRDVDGHRDVYEWHAQGTAGCGRPGGCVALLSSGTAESDSFLYGMTPDGHDVFIWTYQKLLPEDEQSSPSIYDARVDGGFPQPPEEGGCVDSGCQGAVVAAPTALVAGSATFQGAGNTPPAAAGKPIVKKARKPANKKRGHRVKRRAKRSARHKRGRK